MKNIVQGILNLERAREEAVENMGLASSVGACARYEREIARIDGLIEDNKRGFISRYGVDRCYAVLRIKGGIVTYYYENMKDLRFHLDQMDEEGFEYELVETYDASEVIGS